MSNPNDLVIDVESIIQTEPETPSEIAESDITETDTVESSILLDEIENDTYRKEAPTIPNKGLSVADMRAGKKGIVGGDGDRVDTDRSTTLTEAHAGGAQ